MTKPISVGKIDFNLASAMEETKGVTESDTPFRVAILGDFSGRARQGIIETGVKLASRRFLHIDRDNIDDVLKKLGVEIMPGILGKDSEPVSIRFSKMDDFHPDRIFENLEVFQALKEMRQGLKDPATFALMAKESSILPSPPVRKDGEGEGEGNLLAQILEETEGSKPDTESSQRPSEWDGFLREIVKPHLVPDIEKEQAKMVSSIDAAIGELMRMILHHPDFQAIEAAWRAIYFLISRAETEEHLKIYLLDLSKDELAADLSATEDLRKTGIYKLLVEQTLETFGGEPWAVISGSYTFDYTREDAGLLGRMAKIASQAGAPFISAAHPHLAGCESLVQTPVPDDWKWTPDREVPDINAENAWHLLRKLPEAPYIGLVMPRFLLRLPYGADTEPVESFSFEEMPDKPKHEYYLWGNPSFACVSLLAQSFSDYGWDFQPGVILNIGGMPLHVYREDGESKIKPCAEILFTEQAVDVILEKGIMPLISFKNQDSVKLARFQSIADPLTNLAGRWG